MKLNRRSFFKTIFLTISAALAVTWKTFGRKEDKGVRYGMVIDLKKCVGCKSCTVACKAENHTPPGVLYMVVMEEEIGEYPNVRQRFMPRPCFHCKNPSCVPVCPTKATYKRDDGIVPIDYDKCIGCRYCITACPYGARYFDFGEDYNESLTSYDNSASPEYGESQIRQKGKSPMGNARKCHFCLHRVKNGLLPACASTCIGGAIYFGDLNEPNGELRQLIVKRGHMRLKEELGNEPSVYYLL
jgi:molybdopterin-containing oxidoreductase family iron-sulfur binding subunit